jgi:glycine/D-amino acid oxidase-like deaminating enzyme
MTQTSVLIVGAGPTGLVLALILARRGIRVRIIDDDEAPGAHSRAMVVHVDNFAPLQSFDWQLHVYGTPTAGLDDACKGLNLPLHVFAWNEAGERAGFKKDAFYVVRPDGYVGLASARQDVAALKTYVRSRGVRV